MMSRSMHIANAAISGLLVAACSIRPAIAEPPAPVFEEGVIRFEQGEPKGIAFTSGPSPYLIAALAFEGVAVLSPAGDLTDYLQPDDPLSEVTSVAVTDTLTVNNRKIMLVAIADEAKSTVLLRGLDPQSGRFTNSTAINGDLSVMTDTIPSHLCFAQDIYDQSLYLYTGGEHGLLAQYRVIISAGGQIRLRLIRNIAIGGETSSCVADNTTGIVYVVEPETGLWSIHVDPETDALRRPAAVIEPFGSLQEPAAVTLINYRRQVFPLLVDTGAGEVTRLSPEGKVSARLRFSHVFGKDGADGDIESIAGGRFSLNGRLQDVLAIGVQGESGGGQIRLLAPGKLGTTVTDAAAERTIGAIVRPLIETDPAPSVGDAADDPAIWVHPDDPAQSLVLGTDKNGGLMVMDLSGRIIQFLADGRLNNIDLRPGFPETAGLSHIAAATDRTHASIAIYAIDPVARRLSRVDARTIAAEFYDPYGLCMYRSRRNNELYVIATSGDGLLHQWRLFPTATGKVDAERVRRLTIGTVAEGCVADDETGMLYVGEEDVGIWRYGAEPDAGDDREMIAGMKPDGELTDDVEGLTIYAMTDGNGYIVASSQGSNSYALFDRKPPHAFKGMFRIRANAVAGIDGVSETDGLDVSRSSLPGYPSGLLVVQDGRNIEPVENQNFKFVSWEDIAKALGLP